LQTPKQATKIREIAYLLEILMNSSPVTERIGVIRVFHQHVIGRLALADGANAKKLRNRGKRIMRLHFKLCPLSSSSISGLGYKNAEKSKILKDLSLYDSILFHFTYPP
jgi:hypothetical protein